VGLKIEGRGVHRGARIYKGSAVPVATPAVSAARPASRSE
jgi:hypothetical protein